MVLSAFAFSKSDGVEELGGTSASKWGSVWVAMPGGAGKWHSLPQEWRRGALRQGNGSAVSVRFSPRILVMEHLAGELCPGRWVGSAGFKHVLPSAVGPGGGHSPAVRCAAAVVGFL